MKFGSVSLDAANGAVLAHAVSAGERTWRKATVLSAEDVEAMRAAGLSEVVAAVLEPGDLDENAAAALIAEALRAPGIDIRRAATGRVNIHALVPGVLVVNRPAVDAVNIVDPSITLATLPEFSTVRAGQMLATVKIIPFAVPEELARRAVEKASGTPTFSLHPFRALRVGLVQTTLPSLKAAILDKTARLTAQRLDLSGSLITREMRPPHDREALSTSIARLAEDNDLVIVFGASAVADLLDVIPGAIVAAGGEVLRVGMPVDPGNLLVLGTVAGKTVVGAPGCARSPKLNGFDWVLDRLLAGLEIESDDIARMGVGGLLLEIDSRPQPREPRPRPVPVVDAVLLAAGRGQRMGGPNKLLALFSGKPLVRHVADVLAGSRVRATCAVVGHQAVRVEAALQGSGVRVVDNADYATGLSSSLKAGVRDLRPDAEGALVMLGDMPGVTAADIDLLVAAFVNAGGNVVVRATSHGKRGNPVILPRALFPLVATIEGDTGARHIVEASELPVIDVEIGAGAGIDVDTPEAMARAGGVLAD